MNHFGLPKAWVPLLLGVTIGLVVSLTWFFLGQSIQSSCELFLITLGAIFLFYNPQNKILKKDNYYFQAFELSTIGIALISLEDKLLRVNRTYCQLVGLSQQEVINKTLHHWFDKKEIEKYNNAKQKLLQNDASVVVETLKILKNNGPEMWVSLNLTLIRSEDDRPQFYIAQFQDISAEKTSEEQLKHLAYHDTLTGLLNRNRLEQELAEVIANARRYNKGFALLFFDLDNFKNINDTMGHDAGDLLLQIVSERLKNGVRATDLIARLGGDEFLIVVKELNIVDSIANLVQKILKEMLQPIVIKNRELFITTSIGISVYPYDGLDINTLLKNADLALYRAKELGKNTYQFCTPEMTAKAKEKMARQNALVQALAKNEFSIYYQPKLDLVSGRISGVEALLRWNSQEYNVITTDEMIKLSEESGLIIPLNEWVMKTACEQVKIWHAMGFSNLVLAVNISSRQFKQTRLQEHIEKTLIGFPAHCLELEITESLIMQDPEYIFSVLRSIKQLGVKIAIDDFGTGYSSLDYLRRFAIDKIKIDRTFVQRLGIDSETDAIVTAMLAMANKLNIATVAEGVETKQQFKLLYQEKCNEIQGYYLSKPLDAETFTHFIQNAHQNLVRTLLS